MENQSVKESNNTETVDTNTDQEQKNSNDHQSINIKDLTKSFDVILSNHIEGLLETHLGINELELNIFSISSIILLATRETEIETFSHQPPPRYTEDSLLKELAEMSIEPNDELDQRIEDMIDKEYIKVTDERFFSEKPTISMAQLFDRIFPQMPGLNLVAYLGQIIDEVTAGRKTQESAHKQFNQMLELQGVSINETISEKPKKKFSHLKLGDDNAQEKKVVRPKIVPGKPANIFSQLKTSNVIKSAPKAKESIPQSFKEEKPGEDTSPNTIETASDNQLPDEPLTTDTPDDVQEATTAEISQTIEDTQPAMDQEEAASARITDSFDPPDDKDIEDRILEFEEQLGLKCPLCGTGGIKANETARGKAYYHCSSSDCSFISWGRPYYFDCPKCDNNFLIEVADSNGKNFLKCPKATCTHWQKFPWDVSDQGPEYSDSEVVKKKPKRKVRRKRRVVRRKKTA